MRRILLLFFSMVLSLVALDLQAQDRTVTGKVMGSDGASIPGATVLVKGTKVGTSTDNDGQFTLAVPAGSSTLVVSYVGYDSKEIAIGTESSVNVTLKVNTTGLDEVVVVGYGTQARRDLTGNVASISGKEISSTPVQSFD